MDMVRTQGRVVKFLEWISASSFIVGLSCFYLLTILLIMPPQAHTHTQAPESFWSVAFGVGAPD